MTVTPSIRSTPTEITRGVALARTAPGLSSRVRVIFVEAREPDKAAYHAWRDGGAPVAREAVVTLVDCERGRGLVAEVDLDDDRLGAVTAAGRGRAARHLAATSSSSRRT